MVIRFLKNDSEYTFKNGGYDSGDGRVRFDSAEIPAIDGGFHVITDTGIIVDFYEKFTVVYEKTDEYIEFTSDETVYKAWAVYNEDGYVTGMEITSEDIENAVLLASGKGNIRKKVTITTFTDEDGVPLYRVVDGELAMLTEDEKQAYIKAAAAAKEEEEARQEEEAEAAITLEEVISQKVIELQRACQAAIVNGIDYNGKHYSFSTEDQLNINNAVSLASSTGMSIPYHADGESCELYTKEEIMAIYMAEQINLTKNTTYFNQLKLYVQSLTTKAEVRAVVFGKTELTGIYKETYDIMIAQTDALGAAVAAANVE